MENQGFEEFEEKFKEARQKMGHVNIALIGKTGVGKSTLLNAVFKDDFAETGVGRPVTQHSKEYTKEGSLVSILDTKGFELENYQTILQELKDTINERKTGDPKTHIHVVWFCVRSYDKRFEDAEMHFVEELSKEVPVIIVMTQCERKNQEFYDKIKEVAPSARNVVRVLAQDIVEDGEIEKKAYGLDDLTEVTYQLIPEALQSAFASAQKINLQLKKKDAKKAIAASATAVAAACVIPLPFADSAALAPIQIGMLASITHIMGLELSKGFITTLVTSAAGVAGATYAGRAIVTGILKCIPGAGTVLGTAIGAATATTLTTVMGEAYLNALLVVLAASDSPSPEAIAEAFKKAMKKEKIEPVED